MNMKFSKISILLLFILTTHYQCFSQSVSEFLKSAMSSYGNWNSLSAFYYANDRTNINKWQAISFTNPQKTYNKAEVFMDLKKGTFHQHTVFNSPGGYVFDFVFIGKDSTRFLYDKNMSRTGKVLLKQGKDVYVTTMNQIKQTFPFFILESLLETKDSLSYKSDDSSITIQRFSKDGSTQEYLFNPQTLYLEKITRIANEQKTERQFREYKKIDGLLLPMRTLVTLQGNFAFADSVTKFQPNLTIPASVYIIPERYVLKENTTPKPLTTSEISKDVFLVEGVGGDRNMLFINMNDFIVVTEAPLSSDVTKSVIELIRKTIPGKPIKYVHLSHFHSDHTAGIRQFVAEGTTIIATPPMEAPLRAIINGELGPVKDDLSKDPNQPSFELFTNLKVLQDKDHRIEFREVANSHAEGLSFLYLPKEKLIYQGDLLTIPEDSTLTPAIAVTKEFDRYLQKNKLSWNRMIGHHTHSFITLLMFKTMISMKK